ATIDRFWSANFAHKKYSLPLINLALAGAMLLALAQGPGFAADWEHEVRSFLGFSGLLLLDISFGLAGYLFLNDRWVRLGKPPAGHFLLTSSKRLMQLLRNATTL